METPTPLIEPLMGSVQDAARSGDAKPETTEFVCPDCGRSFGTAQGLGRHRTSAHRKNRRSKSKAKPLQQALLECLYPTGIPTSADLGRISAWVAEAKALRGR